MIGWPNYAMSWIENFHSANWNQAGGLCLFAYLLGCLTLGYYLVRMLADKDIREIGSGSVGARNVGRLLGRPGFFLTLAFDFSKGAVAVLTAEHFTSDARLVAMAMLAVTAGHIWPVQLRFHGGKGMATALGALLVYDRQLALTYGALALCLMTAFRRVTLPGLCALASLPLASLLLGGNPAKIILVSALAGLVLVAHRRNLLEEISQMTARRPVDPKPGRSHL
jgi:glycerol-3-phosphate acyltransferase PlsY